MRLLSYILSHGTVTQKELFPQLPLHHSGLPEVAPGSYCQGTECRHCQDVCPTAAITVSAGDNGTYQVSLDLGRCISCGLCLNQCPENVFVRNLSTATAVRNRQALMLSNQPPVTHVGKQPEQANIFRRSLFVRVVSTGCSACDSEVATTGNPVFDLERFGIHVVATPRAADAILVTGPLGLGMQDALRRTYEAAAEPRLVIAAGTDAISGGVHAGGYAAANGLAGLLPVDVYIPGCPPHPWSIIHGLMLAMGRI